MIKAIIFDLDNTLIDRQRAFTQMLYDTFSKYYSDPDLVKQMVSDVLEYDHYGAVSREIAFTKWANKYNVTCVDPVELAQNWSKVSGKTTYLYEDVRPTLTKLKEKYMLAVLSNGNSSSQRRKMACIAIDDLLDYSLISGEFGVNKPDPSIFLYTCEKLSCKKEECVYVGDTYLIDVVGARAAGLRPIYINRIEEEHEDVETIYQISDLLKLF